MKTNFFRKSARALLHGFFQTRKMHVQIKSNHKLQGWPKAPVVYWSFKSSPFLVFKPWPSVYKVNIQYIFSSSNAKKSFAHGLNFRRVKFFVPPTPFLHYLIGESFLQKFDQICAVNILIVITKRTKAYFVLGVMFEKSPDLKSIFCENCKQCS